MWRKAKTPGRDPLAYSTENYTDFVMAIIACYKLISSWLFT